MFTPVSRSRASGEIVTQIERAIFDGAYSPGERLRSERELAEQFKVSRITVRDALRVLEARGLIRVKVGATGGAFVTDTNFDQVVGSISTMVKLRRMTLSELAEARTIVESAAAERAATRADAEAIARLRDMVERSSEVVREGLPHTEVSMDFHVGVAEASGNELLSATVRAYRDLLMQTLHDMRDPSSARETQKWHEDILDAIRAHDADATRKLMQEHLLDFERRIRGYLQTQTKESEAHAKAKLPPPVARIDRVPAVRQGNGR